MHTGMQHASKHAACKQACSMQQASFLSRLRRCRVWAAPRELIVADGIKAHHRSFGLLAGFAGQPQPRWRAFKPPAPQLAGRPTLPRLRDFKLHSRGRADKTTESRLSGDSFLSINL
ncbi:hypothetical protein PYW08_001956 [Mythimna loreyi]|uniref:Uncharacterized protein n=1 Tax=Mythimna loreyi TaxID=667449 RepID=A0ACC2R0L0_9NEOP|nr:hypothetical protein PYW08_001956 [Mythimna loreyi]